MQVRALYDFDAQPGSGELSIRIGEVLTVLRQDVGDGWWEGANEHGGRGLFPESYVEQIVSSGPPVVPPPPLPDQYRTSSSSFNNTHRPPFEDGIGNKENKSLTSGAKPTLNVSQKAPPSSAGGDDFDDDWSDEDSVGQHSLAKKHSGRRNTQCSEDADCEEELEKTKQYLDEPSVNQRGFLTPSPETATEADETEDRCLSAEPTEHAMDGAGRIVATGGGVKKSINRFSRFVQSGMESFILNQVKLTPSTDCDRAEIQLSIAGPKWTINPHQQYTCRLSSFKKASKMRGLKSFIVYQLTPSFSPHSSISRRYKHFDWLHDRLEAKFTFMLIPPLPEKQVSGRFDDEFVEHRMRLLQLWVDKICRHPILSRADVWMHFLTCQPDGKDWKNGKRKAEKDEFIGGNFFFTVSAPPQPLDPTYVEQRFDMFSRKAKILDEAVRTTHAMAAESVKRMSGTFHREFSKYADSFHTLSRAVVDETGSNVAAGQLSSALNVTGDKYDSIAKMYAEQPKLDLEIMMDELFIYKGMISTVPHIAQTQKNVLSRLRDHQKLAEEGKMAPAELEAIRNRVDTVSYAMLSEVSHFEEEHVRDMKSLMKAFLTAQISFYDNIKKQLVDAAQTLD